jgi:hypothetical protein
MPLPVLPRDVVVHHLLPCLTIQDKLVLTASYVSRDWCTWAKFALHIDVRYMQIVVEPEGSCSSAKLSATERVSSSEHFVIASDGRWAKYGVHPNTDDNDTKEYSEQNFNRFGDHLCYRSIYPYKLCLSWHPSRKIMSHEYRVAAVAQAGMTECIKISATAQPSGGMVAGSEYESSNGLIRFLLIIDNDGDNFISFRVNKLRIPMRNMTPWWSSTRDAVRWISIVVMQTPAQQCAWREILAWYGRIGRRVAQTSSSEMHALSLWCFQSYQKYISRMDKLLIQHANANERLVDSSIWMELIQLASKTQPVKGCACIVFWRKKVDERHERQQNCARMFAEMDAQDAAKQHHDIDESLLIAMDADDDQIIPDVFVKAV